MADPISAPSSVQIKQKIFLRILALFGRSTRNAVPPNFTVHLGIFSFNVVIDFGHDDVSVALTGTHQTLLCVYVP